MSAPLFYLGTPEPSWLKRAVDVPLFVSHRRLARVVDLPRATTSWALDSGGFTEITEHGGWDAVPAREYVADVACYDRLIGSMEWAAPQDWMCEAKALAATGLTTAEHQRRTVDNLFVLRDLWPRYSDASCPFIPVLQGDETTTHAECIALYRAAGLDFDAEPLVGIGSVCRLERTGAIERVVGEIVRELPGVPLHGFGVKAQGIERVGHLLASADSQAWSLGARYRDVRHPECTHGGRTCNWCPRAAVAWRDDIVGATVGRFPEHGAPAWAPRVA